MARTSASNIHVNSASTEYTRTIDVVVEQLNRAGHRRQGGAGGERVFWGEVLPFGAYEMSYSWLSCGSVNEPWASMGRYTNAPWYRWANAARASTTPRGGTARRQRPIPRSSTRWRHGRGDPGLLGMVAEAYQHLDAEMPFIPLVQAAKLLPFNTTYWTGWPTADNNYNHPASGGVGTHQIIHNLEKAELIARGGVIPALGPAPGPSRAGCTAIPPPLPYAPTPPELGEVPDMGQHTRVTT
jgi:peptide/nickel transport system substrate-binding protein